MEEGGRETEEEEGEEEHISDSSSSVSSCLTSEVSSPWVESDTNSSSLAETDSLSLFAESGEGLVGEVRGLDAEVVRTGEEMTKERLLLLLGKANTFRRARTGSYLNPPSYQ